MYGTVRCTDRYGQSTGTCTIPAVLFSNEQPYGYVYYPRRISCNVLLLRRCTASPSFSSTPHRTAIILRASVSSYASRRCTASPSFSRIIPVPLRRDYSAGRPIGAHRDGASPPRGTSRQVGPPNPLAVTRLRDTHHFTAPPLTNTTTPLSSLSYIQKFIKY